MINPNEFRIGNKVITYDENWQEMEATITLVYEAHYCVKEHNSAMLWEHLKPIPLTEEWLVEFGFENWDKTRWQIVGKISIATWGEGYLYFSGPLHVNIFYVHQLQNLYFALTGEELVRKCELIADETPIK